MIPQILLLLVSLTSSANAYPKLTNWNNDYNFDEHIPVSNKLNSDCTIVIVAEKRIEFQPISRYPYLIISNSTREFKLFKSTCFILILPEFNGLTDTVKEFMVERTGLVKLTLIYATALEFTNVKKVRNHLKMEIIMINKATGSFHKYEAIDKRCKENLKCILNRRVLRIGYTSGTYLLYREWDHYKSLQQPIPPIILNRTNPVSKHFSGFEAKLLELLVEQYGMTLVMIAPSDFLFGQRESNGTWTGRFGLLSRLEVNCIIPAIPANSERKMLGEFSNYIRISKYVLSSRKIIYYHENWNSLILSFELTMWISIFGTLLIVCPAVWLVTKIHNKIKGVKVVEEKSMLQISAMAYIVLLAKPMRRPPNGPAALIIGSWMICCLIIQCSYISNFMAKLSVPDEELSIDTLEDVWSEKKRIILSKGYTMDSFFKASRDPRLQELYRDRIVPKDIITEEFFELLDAGHVAALPELYTKERIYKSGKSNLYHISSKPFYSVFSSWLFAEDDSEIESAINIVILRASANGLFERWEEETTERQLKKYEFDSRRKQGQEISSSTTTTPAQAISMALYHLEGVFLFWVLGIVISVLVGFIETISLNVMKPKPKNPIIFPYPFLR